MADEHQAEAHPIRRNFVRGLALVEDTVYVGLGILLTIAAAALLSAAAKNAGYSLWHGTFAEQSIALLEQILLVLLIIELLYTVQVSFRQHELLAEPFLVVALIAVIRRVLVITAEVPKLPQSSETSFNRAMLELALLTGMILVLVGSLLLLQKQHQRKASG